MSLKNSKICYLIYSILVIGLNGASFQNNSDESDESLEIKLHVNTSTCKYGYYLNNGTCEECGLTEARPNPPKIVGGVSAVPHSWPAQVLIVQSYKGYYDLRPFGNNKTLITVEFRCGGTLISPDTILTAAHCIAFEFDYYIYGYILSLDIKLNEFYETYESMFDVYLGVHDVSFLKTNTKLPLTVTKKIISKIIIHPNFNTFSYLNDIALLKLLEVAEINQYVKVACLPPKEPINFPDIDQDCYASGWGTLIEGGWAPDELHNVRLRTYNSTLCEPVLPFFNKNWNLQICAGIYSGRKDTCQGDSGGGLYVYDAKIRKYVVSGITSYGNGCGKPKSPGIYTRISGYLEWIYSNSM